MSHPSPALQRVVRFIEAHPAEAQPSALDLRRDLTEAWFSNTLAWLLDPRADHGLGVAFIEAFIATTAKKRSGGDFARRTAYFKWGKQGAGTATSGYSLGNAAVLREFFLSGQVKRHGRSAGYCDLVIADLDSHDGLFVVIENKLFTVNHRSQLPTYRHAVEEKFGRAKVREFVYLTPGGAPPVEHAGEHEARHWIPMSWVEDIPSMLRSAAKNRATHPAVDKLNHLLSWLGRMLIDLPDEVREAAHQARRDLLHAAAACLLDELVRLGEGKTGTWTKGSERSTVHLLHSSYAARRLRVEMLPNFSITIQGLRSGRAHFEKILVPFGAHPDQVVNLLEIAARDIYHLQFDDTHRYLGKAKRHRSRRTEVQKIYAPLFRDAYRYAGQLQALFLGSDHAWAAAASAARELEESEPEDD